MAVGGGSIGLVLLALLGSLFGIDGGALAKLFGQGGAPQSSSDQGGGQAVADDKREFVEVVLKDTENVWDQIFRDEVGIAYRHPKLVLFSGQVRTRCGNATSAVGPFYCPGDNQIYIDPTFWDQLEKRHRAGGDFAQAYVIAHEVAHHVQTLTGYNQKVARVRARGNELETNQASVRLELQADYLAGVWAHHVGRRYDVLQEGDIEEAVNAARQIGDDTLMREAGMEPRPHSYTHGTSAQRVRWFTKGLRSGRYAGCEELFTLPYAEL